MEHRTSLVLEWLPEIYAVCRLSPRDAIPAWALQPAPLASITRTAEELSIVVPEQRVPRAVNAQRGFAAFRVVGTLDFALTGIISRLTSPLAAAGVPVLVLATFDTDYLLVRRPDAERTGEILGTVAAWNGGRRSPPAA